ncbi:MAG: ABC transporter ATP-binding protein/permease [Deltaproteobacteria bacterium]|jgi:ABC-type transport system involved in Fe-S cluster assembly fused permease/ATPase subunit|nr:ABC transporter ATP-binding protein/permease [Deltaproteobacteria bacterium]
MTPAKQFNPAAESKSDSSWQTLKSLLPYLWPAGRIDLKWRVLVAMLSLLIAKSVNVSVPFFLKGAIDKLSLVVQGETVYVSAAIGLTVAYAAARIGQQLFSEFRDFIFARVTQFTQRQIGLRTFEHLHSLSLAFHLDRQTGGLSRVIERGTRGIQTVLQFMLFNILPTIVEVVIVSIVLFFTFGWKFALITMGTIGIYVWYTISITNWRVKFRKEMMQKDTEANTKAIDSLLNFETVKYFGNETHEHKRFDRALEGYEAAAIQSQTSLSILNCGQGVIIAVGLVAVMVLAAQGVVQKTMTIGDFVAINTFLIQLYLPLNILGFAYRETTQSLVEMDKMFELLSVERDIKDIPGARALKLAAGGIEFKNVSFHYSADRPILKNVSFEVQPGKTVAIVGPSGSGKSTLSRLLFRFYDPTVGAVLIDKQDLREVEQASVRRAIGIVPQDTVLFNDTIGYNIQYGRPEATEKEMKEAARLAKIDSFVARLPQGYKSMVGERGLKLSGGEKQRVAIARTILKNPKILVFDEATSALDTQTEQGIQASLREVARDRTALVIAHRLSTVVDADLILVLKDGEIVERGRHDELLKIGGEYSRMWKLQAEAQDAKRRLDAVTSEAHS